MTCRRIACFAFSVIAGAVLLLSIDVAGSQAAAPIKEVLTGHIAGVNNVNGVAVENDPASPQYGNVFVADNDQRVQEFTPSGQFVLVFGQEVNETTGGQICTENEVQKGTKCKVGVEGASTGQFAFPTSLAVDPDTGNIYVLDYGNWRIQEFSSTGEFILTFGKQVNETATVNHETTNENVCPVRLGDKCGAGIQSLPGSTEHGAFKPAQNMGDLLTVDSRGIVYVGDEHRVQEFKANGEWVNEIPLSLISSAISPPSKVIAVAADNSCALQTPPLADETPACELFDSSNGNLYLIYRVNFEANTIHEFGRSGLQLAEFGAGMLEGGLAADTSGQLATSEFGDVGSLYDAATGHSITNFTNSGTTGIAFASNNIMYVAGGNEVLVYTPLPVAELETKAEECKTGQEHETEVTLDCSLHGEVNPEGVGETEVWFEWGRSKAFGSKTAVQHIPNGSTRVSVTPAVIEGVRPNEESFFYRLAGYDEHVKPPEDLTSEIVSFTTPIVAPKIVAPPMASFVKATSVVLFDELNPENASTVYEFQYGPCMTSQAAETQQTACEKSPYPSRGTQQQSSAYGEIGATEQVTSLQPSTTYHDRLVAKSENNHQSEAEEAIGDEGEFSTVSAPSVEASTGPATIVTSTTASVSGVVNADGEQAAYMFELGVFAGVATQYGVVFSGPAGAGTIPVTESLNLTDLQPGLEYSYRIAIRSGYGAARGEPRTFKTIGLTEAVQSPLSPLLLGVPTISFPTVSTPKTLTSAQKLAQALKLCAKKPSNRRGTCRRRAHRRYPVNSGVARTNSAGNGEQPNKLEVRTRRNSATVGSHNSP